MKVIKVLLLVLSVLAFRVEAQDLSNIIISQDVLREYALKSVVRGYRDVTSPSIVHTDNEVRWTSAAGDGAEQVLDRLFNVELVYTLSNPNDSVQGRVWLYDEYDNLVFYGYAEYVPSELKGNPPPTYSIWMQDIILPFDGVESAEVIVLGEDGVTARQLELYVDDGLVHFQPWLAGAPNGILSIRFDDGTLSTFNLWDAVAKTPTATTENANWKIDGHHVVTVSGVDPQSRVVNIIETWNLPTLYLVVETEGYITFNVLGMGSENGVPFIERPFEFVREQVDGPWAGAGPMKSDTPTEIHFSKGIHRVHFGFQKFGKPYMIYVGPAPDGKG